MIDDPPLEDETFIISASLALSLELERLGRMKEPPMFTEDVGCTSELDTTAGDEEEEEQRVLVDKPEIWPITPRTIRTPSPFEFQSLGTLPEVDNTQPNVLTEKSEEEEEIQVPKQSKQRQSNRLKEQRKQTTEVEQAIYSTMATFDDDAPNKKVKHKDKLVHSWRNMYRITCKWLIKIHEKEELRKSSFHTFLLNGVNALRRTLNYVRPRSPEVHEITLRFIVDFNKIFEIAKMRGLNEVMGTIGRLVESVLGLYLSSSKRMSPTNLAWMQTKQVMKTLMSVTMSADSAYGLLQLISKIQMYFISKWGVRPNRNEEFIAYAISQMQFLSSILTGRLELFANQRKYCIRF